RGRRRPAGVGRAPAPDGRPAQAAPHPVRAAAVHRRPGFAGGHVARARGRVRALRAGVAAQAVDLERVRAAARPDVLRRGGDLGRRPAGVRHPADGLDHRAAVLAPRGADRRLRDPPAPARPGPGDSSGRSGLIRRTPGHCPPMRPVTRRAVLGGLLATPLLAACAGFDTNGAAAPGTVGFLSTQFTPVEERQRFEQVLRSQLPVPVAYNPVEGGVFTTTIKSQAQARNVRTALIGGLYNDLAPLADAFDDVGGLLSQLSGAGYPHEILKLTTLGGTTPKFVPWMQATYIVAVNKQALQWL